MAGDERKPISCQQITDLVQCKNRDCNNDGCPHKHPHKEQRGIMFVGIYKESNCTDKAICSTKGESWCAPVIKSSCIPCIKCDEPVEARQLSFFVKDDGQWQILYQVKCKKCGHKTYWHLTDERAVKHWNEDLDNFDKKREFVPSE